MSASEFAEWIAYSKMFPFGENQDSIRAGTVASAIVNIHRRKGAKALRWQDFFPPYERRAPSTNWRSMLTKAIALNKHFGGEDKRQNKAPADV